MVTSDERVFDHGAFRSGPVQSAPVRSGRRKRVDRSIEFVEAAIRVIRREGSGASMEQIAAEAGVSKPILYRHFVDRAGLVNAVGKYSSCHLTDALARSLQREESPRQLVVSTIDTYLAFIEADSDVYRFLVHGNAIEPIGSGVVLGDYVRRTGRQVASVLGEAMRAVGVDAGPVEAWSFGIVGMVHAAGDWWLEGSPVCRAQLCGYLTTLIVDGLPFKRSTLGRGDADEGEFVNDLASHPMGA